jgi:hypothetical protein
VDKFVHDENIRLFQTQLAETTDPEKRRVLLKLLAAEEANGACAPPKGRSSSRDQRSQS